MCGAWAAYYTLPCMACRRLSECAAHRPGGTRKTCLRTACDPIRKQRFYFQAFYLYLLGDITTKCDFDFSQLNACSIVKLIS